MAKPRSNLADHIGKRHGFDSAEQEAYLNLIRTTDRLSAGFARLFKTHGLSEPQYNVLRILRGAGDAITTHSIARQMISRQPDISRLIDRLEKADLVARRRCSEDRRVVWVEITRAGRKLLTTLDRPVTELHRTQLGHVSQRDLKTLSRLLFKAARDETEEPHD